MVKKKEIKGIRSFNVPQDVQEFLDKKGNASEHLTEIVRDKIKEDSNGRMSYLKSRAIFHQERMLLYQGEIFQLEYEEKARLRMEKEKRKEEEHIRVKMQVEEEIRREHYLIKKEIIRFLGEGRAIEEVKRLMMNNYPKKLHLISNLFTSKEFMKIAKQEERKGEKKVR